MTNMKKMARHILAPFLTATAMTSMAMADEKPVTLNIHDFADQVMGMPQKYLDLLPNDPDIVVSNMTSIDPDAGHESANVLAANHNGDFAVPFRVIPTIKICTIFSYTRAGNIIADMEKLMGITIEPAVKATLDTNQLAFRVYNHEIGHCRDPNVFWTARMIRESVADVSAIQPLLALEPDSNIDRIVIAYRTLSRGYQNAAMVERMLAGITPAATDVTNDSANDFALHRLLQTTIRTPGAVLGEDPEQTRLRELIYLRHLRDTPGHDELADQIRLRIQAFQLFQPNFSARADAAYRILTAVIKPGVTVPAQP